MIYKLTLILISILVLSPSSASDDFSLYFVRHAEKITGDTEPGLTACGKERAKQLATLLSTADIKSIYSSSYKRTMSTASPFSKATNVAIKNYSPKHLQQFALQLKQRHENALIVGHSNTTPQLVSLLIDKKIAPLTEHDYQMLYQVSFINNKVLLNIFTQPLICD